MSAVKKVAKKAPAARLHPSYPDMIKKAIKEMKDRKGSSRQAIIKYIRANFKISPNEHLDSLVRRCLVAGVKSGKLVQAKGTGASGSFKLADKSSPKKKVAKKPKTKTPKKKAAKKAPAAAAAPTGEATAAAPAKAKKSPKKVKKTPKKPAAKKTPKKAGVKKTPKKASAKKAAKPKVTKPKAKKPAAAKA